MMNFSQGDIIKISNLKDAMLVVSKNEFIKKTGVFHVCPLLENYAEGPSSHKSTRCQRHLRNCYM